MTKTEYKRLQAYAAVARSVQDEIENVQRLYKAVRYRAAEKQVPLLQVGVSVPHEARAAFGSKYDAGCYVRVPLKLVRDGIMPVLREALKNAKAELAALPAATVEKQSK
jgi:hypothetical protein